MSDQAIELKGAGFTLSVVQIFTADLNRIESQLRDKISQVPQFFHMAPVVINIQTEVPFEDFLQLKQLLQTLNLVPVGVSGCSVEQKVAIQQTGMAFMSAAKNVREEPAANSQNQAQPKIETVTIEKTVTVKESVPSKIVRQNLRSGQQIYAKDSDLVIIGSVSNGAEIIADGSIHIYGTLRGRAIAGASGRDDVSIFSRKLQAELVSINGHYWTSDQLHDNWERSVCISLSGEQLKVSPLEL